MDRRLAISRAKQLALVADPDADRIAALADTLDLAELEARAAHARHVEQRATTLVGTDPTIDAPRLDRTVHAATHATVGATVKALDRNNIGTVTHLDDHAGTVRVLFIATDGRQAERTMTWSDVQVMDADATPRPLSDAARSALERIVTPAHEQQKRWTEILSRHGVHAGDRVRYERATHLKIDRAARALAATQPTWLTELIGTRPARPAAAQVWDDAVRSVAAYRSRHRVPESIPAVGFRPHAQAGADGWDDVHRNVGRTRVWLDSHDPATALPPARTRSPAELRDRLHELDAILATAPADQRTLISQLHADGTLPYDNVNDLLADALSAQGDRQRWILEHWPHVVEYAELRAATDTPGPDIGVLLGVLRETPSPALADAAERSEPWLVRLAGQLIPDAAAPDPAVVGLLGDVAAHRARWHITHPAPLDIAAWDPEQAAERGLLASAIDAARPVGVESRPPDLVELDLGVGY